MYFLKKKKSPTHGQKSSHIFDVNFLLQYIDGFFDRVWAPIYDFFFFPLFFAEILRSSEPCTCSGSNFGQN